MSGSFNERGKFTLQNTPGETQVERSGDGLVPLLFGLFLDCDLRVDAGFGGRTRSKKRPRAKRRGPQPLGKNVLYFLSRQKTQ
jgi:hypothetical protein